MNNCYIGKIWDTHGIKGEVRILLDDLVLYNTVDNKVLSHDEIIDLVFKKNDTIYIENEKLKFITYRHHKIYEMVTFEGLNNINDVLKYRKKKCYVDNNIFSSNIISINELLNYNIIYNNENYGKIVDYQNNNGNILLKINFNKEYYIPLNVNFIKYINKEEKSLQVENIEGLIL